MADPDAPIWYHVIVRLLLCVLLISTFLIGIYYHVVGLALMKKMFTACYYCLSSTEKLVFNQKLILQIIYTYP